MKVCYVFSLESPHRGDSNEYTQHTIVNIKNKITLNYPQYDNVCSHGMFFQGTQERVRNSHGNEPSVFEPFKFYCAANIGILCLHVPQSHRKGHFLFISYKSALLK